MFKIWSKNFLAYIIPDLLHRPVPALIDLFGIDNRRFIGCAGDGLNILSFAGRFPDIFSDKSEFKNC